jgi:hypothetical protein
MPAELQTRAASAANSASSQQMGHRGRIYHTAIAVHHIVGKIFRMPGLESMRKWSRV